MGTRAAAGCHPRGSEEKGAAGSGGELAAVQWHSSSAFPRPHVPNVAN